jgi:hypothetical protein
MLAPLVPNQNANGLAVMINSQSVGSHKDKEAAGYCLWSSFNKKTISAAKMINAMNGGMASLYAQK